jgi:hypothetical protein
VTQVIDLAFDPNQLRDQRGRWTGIPGGMAGSVGMRMAQRAGLLRAMGSGREADARLRADPAREAARMKGVQARQRKSGIWGGLTFAQHEAEVAKLSPAQREVYNREQSNGRPLPAALAMARTVALSNGGTAVPALTAGQRARTQPGRVRVTSPFDIHVSRGPAGQAIIVHRRAGQKIGELVKLPDGRYAGKIGEQVLAPHTQQRAALFEMIGTHNKNASQPLSEVQPPVTQTPLMAQYGVPAVQAYANGVRTGINLAAAANSSSDGPRSTTAGSDSDDSDSSGPAGLTPKGVAIYKKLLAKGFPAARALLFARRSQSFGSGGGDSSS